MEPDSAVTRYFAMPLDMSRGVHLLFFIIVFWFLFFVGYCYWGHYDYFGVFFCCRPATLLLSDEPIACSWFLTACTFSMFPLLLKDGLAIPTFALVVFFLTLCRTFLDWRSVESENHAEKDENEELQEEFVSALVRNQTCLPVFFFWHRFPCRWRFQ